MRAAARQDRPERRAEFEKTGTGTPLLKLQNNSVRGVARVTTRVFEVFN